jgi:uncharacterized protein (TIGR00251 family)
MADAVELRVRVQPRASRNEVTGWRNGVLALRLTAPPVEGAANRACRDFLAETLGVKRADVELVSGETSRDKRFRITGLDAEELRRRLARWTTDG